MNTAVYLTLVVAACLCLTDGAPEGRLSRKQQRPTRGFKNLEMMTARGFGKRAEHERMRFHPKSPLMVAYDFGKRSGNDDLDGEEEEIRVTRGTFKPNANVLIARGYGKRHEADKTEDDGMIRVIRGSFKPNYSNILIARGYGKRQEGNGVYGMDNFWENLEAAQEKDGQDTDGKTMQRSCPRQLLGYPTGIPRAGAYLAQRLSLAIQEEIVVGTMPIYDHLDGHLNSFIPLDWFVNEMVNNPDFARSVVRKFIDLDQDGMLTSEELIRNV